MTPLRIGPLELAAPVVLAPMAGVTNAPFRALCRRFGPGLLYVNEMVMSVALLHQNAKTEKMVTFADDETPRSLQIYGSDPANIGEAIRRLCDADRVDHIEAKWVSDGWRSEARTIAGKYGHGIVATKNIIDLVWAVPASILALLLAM